MKNIKLTILLITISTFILYLGFYLYSEQKIDDSIKKTEPITNQSKDNNLNEIATPTQEPKTSPSINKEENKPEKKSMEDDNYFQKISENTFKNSRKDFLPYHPVKIEKIENSIYYLINGKLYFIDLNSNSNSLLVQIYNNIETDIIDIAYDNNKTLFLLDKSNKIFSYNIKNKKLILYFTPYSFPIEPDPQNISIIFSNNNLYSLDSARNQIWIVNNNKLHPFFKKEPLVWKLTDKDRNITNSYGFYNEKNLFYIAKRNNTIDIYRKDSLVKTIDLKIDSSNYGNLRLYSNSKIKELYIIGGYNNSIYSINKDNGNFIDKYTIKVNNEILPVYDLFIKNNKFYILAGNYLLIRDNLNDFKDNNSSNENIDVLENYLETKSIKNSLIPVNTQNITLPENAGMFPGARRLYRHGVHEGIDFFTASENDIFIDKKTEVLATQRGKIIRIDSNYSELSPTERQKILLRCNKSKNTSQEDADKLKGQQVVIEHENNVISSYSHLSNVANLKVGDDVNQGDVIGYVGNSGTSDGIVKNNNNLHLHFEIHIDDNSKYKSYYLGKNLSIEETIQLYTSILKIKR